MTRRVGRDDVIWAFAPNLAPVLEVDPGMIVTLETNNCFTGQIQSEADLLTDGRPCFDPQGFGDTETVFVDE